MALGTPDSSLRTNDTSLSCIFSVLSDNDSLKIIDTIAGSQLDLKIGDFDTPKRYYSRLSKLKKASIIRKKGRSYALTSFGSILYNTIQTVKQAHGLQWKLEVVDAIDESLPHTERQSIIESLIPNKLMRNILIESRATH
jgi:pyruvate/2-oxoglutarate/acetoin dehydrogenase E1 component